MINNINNNYIINNHDHIKRREREREREKGGKIADCI